MQRARDDPDAGPWQRPQQELGQEAGRGAGRCWLGVEGAWCGTARGAMARVGVFTVRGHSREGPRRGGGGGQGHGHTGAARPLDQEPL